MPEWFKEFLIAIGGGSAGVVVILTICKSAFLKVFDNIIGSTFEKNLEKYRNKLSRSTKAFEIILDREMRFYKCTEPLFAEMVPLAQDLLYYMKHDEAIDREVECEAYRKNFNRYLELIKELKNEMLTHQLYIPQSVFMASTALVKQMQDDSEYWLIMAKLLFSGEYEKIDYTKGQEKVDEILLGIVKMELVIKERLDELSEV